MELTTQAEEAKAAEAKAEENKATAAERLRKRRPNEEVMHERITKAIQLLQENGYEVNKASGARTLDDTLQIALEAVNQLCCSAKSYKQELEAAKAVEPVDIQGRVEQLFRERVSSVMSNLLASGQPAPKA